MEISGLGSRCLHCLTSIKFFILVFGLASFTQGLFINGLVTVNLPTLEKVFGISSTKLGLIVSSNDMAAVLFVSFVSFFGAQRCKPRWIGIGSIITGIGGLLFALPRLTRDPHSPQSLTTAEFETCPAKNTTAKTCDTSAKEVSHVLVFFLANFIMGAGTTPLFTLGPTYIDENLPPREASFYLGVAWVFNLMGPVFGFLVGGAFLQIHTDLNLPEHLKLTPKDPRWVGAWWLSFVSISVLFFISGFLLLVFPKETTYAKKFRRELMKAGDIRKDDKSIQYTFKGFLAATLKLCKNKLLMLIIMALTTRSIFIIGMVSFLVKILILKFGVAPLKASTALGIILIPPFTVGIMSGSLLMKLINPKVAGKRGAFICCILSIVVFANPALYLIPGCENTMLAGVSAPYPDQTRVEKPSLLSSCNQNCNCSKESYFPICGVNGITYHSPCFAGCQTVHKDENNVKVFGNCTCVTPQSSNKLEYKQANLTNASAGKCDRKCKNFLLFAGLVMLTATISLAASTPHQIMLLRCVPDNQRSFAVGVQFLVMRLLSFLPGPIIIGAIFDSQCITWGYDGCGRKKNCLDYDMTKLSTNLSIFGLTTLVVSAVLYGLAYFLYPVNNMACQDEVIQNENAIDNKQGKKDVEDDTKL